MVVPAPHLVFAHAQRSGLGQDVRHVSTQQKVSLHGVLDKISFLTNFMADSLFTSRFLLQLSAHRLVVTAALVRLPTLVHVLQLMLVQLVLCVGDLLIFCGKKCGYFLAVCTPACSNSGICTSPGVCTCTSSWAGSRCTTRMSRFSVGEIGIRSCILL